MRNNIRLFFFLLFIVAAAGGLAILVRAWNDRVVAPPHVVPTPGAPTSSQPLVVNFNPTGTSSIPNEIFVSTRSTIDAYVTSTNVSPHEFVSMDRLLSVVVDSNLPELPSTFMFSGTATAFENTAAWRLIESSGKLVASGVFYVSSTDVGVPGPFRVTASYAVSTSTPGSLLVYEASAKDGSPLHLVRIPVQLIHHN